MQSQVLEANRETERLAAEEQLQVMELTNLQLALVGGGCAEVCPY